MQTGRTIAIAAISGMGGIGKTELALQYAYQQRELQTYPGGICWLRGQEVIGTTIIELAYDYFRLVPPDDRELSGKVEFCWRHWQAGAVLVIFDDVQSYEEIRPFLPPAEPRFKVLLTTRLTLQSPVQNFEITVLSEAKAIALLRAIVPDGRIDQDLATAKLLCHWLGCLPLGVELVGRYLALDAGLSLKDMLTRLQQESVHHPALVGDEHDPMWTSTAKRGVAAAFELSWQTLDPAAQQLGELLSLFALAPIPWHLVEATIGERNAAQRQRPPGWRHWLKALWQWLRSLGRQRQPPPPKFALSAAASPEKARRSLIGLHLLQHTEENTYQLHQLLREFFAAKREQMAAKEEMQQSFRSTVLSAAQKSSETPERSLLAETTVLIPHLQAVVQLSETSGQETDVALDLAWLAHLYRAQGRYADAEPLYTRALAIKERQLGQDHPAVATSLNNLAYLYQAQGRYADAEPLYTRALAIRERQLGQDHPDVATSLNNLAGLYQAQGRTADAEPLYTRALEICERQLGQDHPDVATSLNNLAELYRAQGRYADAEPRYTRALAIWERQLGQDHPDVATSLNNLAGLYEAQGRTADAEPLYTRALAIWERQLGQDHPAVATSLNNLAGLYEAQGRYADAEPLYTRALAIRERQLGQDHPAVATSLNNLAGLYEAQGRYADAEPLYTRALEIKERQLGQDHPAVATSLNNLAYLYQAQGRTADAEPLYTRALAIRERQLGQDHPDVATSLNNLAGLYQAQGRTADAEPLYTRALEICERQLGQDHPDVATSLNNLAELYRAQGRYADAEPRYTRALAIKERQLGQDHPAVATSLNNLAGLYRAQGRTADAEPLYTRALAILFAKLGDDHPNTQTVWQNFVGFLQQAIEAGQTGQLSEHEVTQDLLRQMREGSGESGVGSGE